MGVPYRTLSEMAMGLGQPDITNIVDEITKTTAIVPDASFIEASGMLDHTGMRKLSLPENAWVTVDEGGAASRGCCTAPASRADGWCAPSSPSRSC